MSGGLFSLLIAAGLLLSRTRRPIDYTVAGIYICHGGIAIIKGLACSGLILKYPFFMHWDLFLYYPISPLIYLYLRMLIDPEFNFRKKHLGLFIPAFFIILLYIPFLILPPEQKLQAYPYYMTRPPGLWRTVIAGSYILPSLMIFIYTTAGLKQYSMKSSYQFMTRTGPMRCILFLCGEIIILALLMITAYFFWSYNFYRIIFLGLNQVVVCFYLLTRREPNLYTDLKNEVRKNRTTVSQISGLDIPLIVNQINEQFIEKQVFTNPELNLPQLSSLLGISPHQLSEILNKKMNTSFRSLLNQYRIDAAEKMLKKKTGTEHTGDRL